MRGLFHYASHSTLSELKVKFAKNDQISHRQRAYKNLIIRYEANKGRQSSGQSESMIIVIVERSSTSMM